MRAMILAAGRGERMGVLTQATPKPLIKVQGKYLIQYTIEQLVASGVTEIVINTSYLGEQIPLALGDGSQWGANIAYSHEPERLETGGGIVNALPLLGDKPFLVVSGDIISAYPFAKLKTVLNPNALAHLILVPNPSFKPQGDFGLVNGYLDLAATPRYTFGNIGVYHPVFFANCEPVFFPLNQLLRPAIAAKQITGEVFNDSWFNIGSPAELDTATELLL